MSSIRTNRFARATCLGLLIAMVIPLTPWAALAAGAEDPLRTVLLFPVSDESSSAMPELRQIATDSLQMAIDTAPDTECTEFSRTSPLVRRAAAEGRILPTQIEAGVSNARDAINVGHQLGVDTVVVASIQSYRSTQSPRSVEVIIAGQAYDVVPNFDADTESPVDTPTVAQAFGVTGLSRKLPGYKGSDRPLAREAVEDASYRVAKVLGGASISDVAKPKPVAKERNKVLRWLAIAAVIGGLAWAVSSSGGDDDGGTVTAVPPTPLPPQPEGTDTIRLRWNEPTGITVPVLQYQLQRSVNSGTWSYFGTGTLSDNVRDTTTFADFDVSSGNTYVYRIRAIYRDSKASAWVQFSGISL